MIPISSTVFLLKRLMLHLSYELKRILENFNGFGVQFFPTFIIHKGKKIDNYWQTHFYDSPYDYIDFKNTDLLLKDRDENRKPVRKSLQRAESKEDFLEKLSSYKYPNMLVLQNISFKKGMNLDFFFLQNFSGANHGIVSDRLKTAIDIQHITGSEFKPMNMDLNGWFGTNGLREKIYGPIPQARSNGSIEPQIKRD